MREYILIKDYLKRMANIHKGQVFVGKTKNSYLVGPVINDKFDEFSFYKRITSSTVVRIKDYKKISKKKALELVDSNYDELKHNEMLEIFTDGHIVKHKIIPLQGDKNEE